MYSASEPPSHESGRAVHRPGAVVSSRLPWLPRILVALGAVAAITAFYFRVVSVNPTTVALTYVVAVLVIATGWGLVEATAASLSAVLCFNFFFLPPVGTWIIA